MVCIVFAGSMFTAFVTSYTIWPFFSYSMYAYPEKDATSYPSVEIELNGKIFDSYRRMSGEKATNIENAANNYYYLKTNHFTDRFAVKLKEKKNITLPAPLSSIFNYKNLDDAKFALWLKRYIESNTTLRISTIKLNKVEIAYLPKATIIKRKPILIQKFNPSGH